MIGWLASWLAPQRALAGAALAALLLGSVLLDRQCAAMTARADLRRANADLAGARAELQACQAQKGALAAGNAQLALAAQEQSAAVERLRADAEARAAAGASALRAARAEAVEQRSSAQWLAGLVARKSETVKPGECEAATAARVVREGLK